MTYALSFSPEFFFAEGEPYDGGPELPAARPISVWSAIETMRLTKPEEWAEMAREVFDCEPEFLGAESVLEKVKETDTCSNLDVPVEVWIDAAGDFRLEVYNEKPELKVRSGYTHCLCRDCFEVTVSSDVTKPEFCSECEEHGCEEESECQVPPETEEGEGDGYR